MTPTRLRGQQVVGSNPNNRALPEVGLRKPRRRLMAVVLPAPSSEHRDHVAELISKLTPFNASTLPYFLVASTIWAR